MNRNRQSERGVALVITLVMLSVVTLMAVFFLGISRREKASVTVASDLVGAKLMADAALARAESEVAAKLLSEKSRFAYDLLVSTNMINPEGYSPARGNNPTNVAYQTTSKGLLEVTPLLSMLANLQYDPRPPVFIPRPVSANALPVSDFRFYLDLNRNGLFEPTGWMPVRNAGGAEIKVNGQTLYDYMVGDPQWIGMLERPDLPHSGSNRFVGRYAYLVMPAGKSLDINHIHNYTRPLSDRAMTQDRFFRNQGVGSWEINLAAFLRELNTNVWSSQNLNNSYFYDSDLGRPNLGAAFNDALAILRYRYDNAFDAANLFTAKRIYGAAAAAFENDGIDSYSDGPLADLTLTNLDLSLRDQTDLPWAGSENPSRISHIFELFELGNTYGGTPPLLVTDLQNRLNRAFVNPVNHPDSTYDKYTFYRMLAQMGTESHENDTTWIFGPDFRRYPTNKININFRTDGTNQLRSLTPWGNEAEAFFVQAADRLLRAGLSTNIFTNQASKLETNFYLGLKPSVLTNEPWFRFNVVQPDISVTNIQIYHKDEGFAYRGASNEYNATLHRLLQVAANVYDSTTNRLYTSGTTNVAFPTVFRPYFYKDDEKIIIAGYLEVTNSDVLANQWYTNVTELWERGPKGYIRNANVVGVPFVVGAKKGFPNFNEASMDTSVQVTRRLELRKDFVGGDVRYTNQVYILTVSNQFGIEGWNSYALDYQPDSILLVTNRVVMSLYRGSGDTGPYDFSNPVRQNSRVFSSRLQITNWPGTQVRRLELPAPESFIVPLNTNIAFVPESAYRTMAVNPQQALESTAVSAFTNYWERTFAVPRLLLRITNYVQYIMVDEKSNRIIDFVNLEPMTAEIDIQQRLRGDVKSGAAGLYSDERKVNTFTAGDFWVMDRPTPNNVLSPTYGVLAQLAVNRADPRISDAIWRSASADRVSGEDKERAVEGFKEFITPGSKNPMISMQTPFNPSRLIIDRRSWQANDPLVHYMLEDLLDPILSSNDTNNFEVIDPPDPAKVQRKSNLKDLNARYRPWGRNGKKLLQNADDFRMSLVDPGIRSSDDWRFPTNKFPSIGWLGRVHRGTPWQTIYLKSAVEPTNSWFKWN